MIPFHPCICNICYEANAPELHSRRIKFCSGCKLIGYCGLEHQAAEWESHKHFCKAILELRQQFQLDNVFQLQVVNSKKNLDQLKMLIKQLVQEKLQRDLQYHETVLIDFARICNVCCNSSVKRWHACDTCKSVFYCSAEHRETDFKIHNRFCHYFKFIRIFGKDVTHTEPPNTIPTTPEYIPHFPSDSCTLLELFLHRKISKLPDAPEDISDFISACHFSFVATCLFAIKNFPCVDRHKITVFTIDVVGVEFEAFAFDEKYSWMFFSYFPTLTKLTLNLVGPGIIETPTIEITLYGNKTVILQYRKEFYQNYVPPKDNCPDLIVAFNCGFSEFAQDSSKFSWKPAILKTLTNRNIPIAFTSYTRNEAVADWNVVQNIWKSQSSDKSNLKVILKGDPNPFKDYRPIRNTECSDEEEIYFINGYMSLFYVD